MNHPTEYYKGYTIQLDLRNRYNGKPEYMFYPTEQGIQDDHDYCDGSFIYMGNCKPAGSIKEAKLLIDEIVPFFVETFNKRGTGLKITKFDWLSDAIKFAGKFNGELSSMRFTNP